MCVLRQSLVIIICILISGAVIAENRYLKPIFHGPRTKKIVALTFDDGPHPARTPQILEVLKKHKVKATFFMVAKQVKKFPKTAAEVKRAGHSIGSHTINHPRLKKCSLSKLQEEIGGSVKIIKAYTGVKPRYFRPTYGQYDQRIMRMAEKYGMQTILWDADASDYYRRRSAETIQKLIVRKTKPGSIILLHEKRASAVKALDKIIPALKAKGYKFVKLKELLKQAQ